MKKIALALVLGLLLQTVPTRATASTDPQQIGGVLTVGLIGFLLLTDGGSASKAKITGDEFADLNNNPAFNSLLKQMAGGNLNTLEILK